MLLKVSLHGILAVSSALSVVTVPLPLLQLGVIIPLAGLSRVVLARQVSPPLILNEAPTSNTMNELGSGREPVNPLYVMCHGSVAVRIVAAPVTQVGLFMALEMWPISDLSTLAMVLEWKLPSRVTSQLAAVPNAELNFRDLQAILNKLPWLMLRLFAEAELTASAIRSAAVILVRMSLLRVRIGWFPLRYRHA